MDRRGFLNLPLGAALLATGITGAHAALVPAYFLDCVVALGFSGPGVNNGVPVMKMWHTIGTGFFYGYLRADAPDVLKRLYSCYLVTAKHVIDDYNKAKAQNSTIRLSLRVNPIDVSSAGREFDVKADLVDHEKDWVNNPNGKDVAVIPINLESLRNKKFDSSFFTSDTLSLTTYKMREAGISAGDGVFILGFPMDLAGAQKNYVIVREGVIARIAELLDNASDTFLVNSFVFPGNSGGPVVLKPEASALQGTKPISSAFLIGLVVASVNYVDTAVSQQTGRARITFEENSGLANIVPVDHINDTIYLLE